MLYYRSLVSLNYQRKCKLWQKWEVKQETAKPPVKCLLFSFTAQEKKIQFQLFYTDFFYSVQ